MRKFDMLKGGPGLDGYAYHADVYCVDCGQDIIRKLEDRDYTELEAGDMECVPVPIFFGESPDCEQYCTVCGEYLYGGNSDV